MRDAAVAKDDGEFSEDDFEIFGVSRDDCGVPYEFSLPVDGGDGVLWAPSASLGSHCC